MDEQRPSRDDIGGGSDYVVRLELMAKRSSRLPSRDERRNYSHNPLPYSEGHANYLPPHGHDPEGTYQRMRVHPGDRVLTILISTSAIAYVVLGLWIDDLIIPAGKVQYDDVHVQGPIAPWLLAGAVLCMVIFWLRVYAGKSVLVERRPLTEYPESKFKHMHGGAEQLLRALGWCLLAAAAVAHVVASLT